MHVAHVALEEHLGDAGRGAEVAVDLERRMGVEEVGVGAALELLAEHLVGVVAVEESRPEVDLPRLAPARAAVAAARQRHFGARRQLRVRRRRDLAPGVQGEQVRDVAVPVLGVVAVGHPLLELSPFADLRPYQLAAQRRQTVAIRLVFAQRIGRVDGVGEEVPHDLLVIRHAVLGGAVLGRPAHGHHQTAVGQGLQLVFPELADLLEHGVGHVPQVFLVAAEGVVLPQVLAVPGAAGLVPLPAHAAHDVVGGADRPAADLAAGRAELLGRGRRLHPRFPLAHDQPEERRVALGEVGRLRGPVVHLDVDVGVVVAVPRRLVAVVPQPLEIGRQPTGPRAGDEQVAAVLEEEVLEARVVALGLVGVEPLAGGQGALLGGRLPDAQLDAVEERLVVLHVGGPQRVEGLRRGGAELLGEPRVGRVAAPVPRVVHHVVRACRKQEGQAVAGLELERRSVGRGRAAVVERDDLRLVLEPVGQCARGGQAVGLRGHLRLVRIGQLEGARVAAGLVGREPHDEHLVGVAGQILPLVADASALVAHPCDGLADVELPAVARRRVVGGQLEVHVAKCLVGPHRAVAARGVLVARPQAVLIELDPLRRGAAEDHRAEPPVADGERLGHPVLRRLAVPQRQVPWRRRRGGEGHCGRGRSQNSYENPGSSADEAGSLGHALSPVRRPRFTDVTAATPSCGCAPRCLSRPRAAWPASTCRSCRSGRGRGSLA